MTEYTSIVLLYRNMGLVKVDKHIPYIISPSIIHYPSFMIHHLSSIIHYLLSIIYYLLSIIYHPSSTMNHTINPYPLALAPNSWCTVHSLPHSLPHILKLTPLRPHALKLSLSSQKVSFLSLSLSLSSKISSSHPPPLHQKYPSLSSLQIKASFESIAHSP